jgi:hypothetical protein
MWLSLRNYLGANTASLYQTADAEVSHDEVLLLALLLLSMCLLRFFCCIGFNVALLKRLATFLAVLHNNCELPHSICLSV